MTLMDTIRRSHTFSSIYIVQLLDPSDAKTGDSLYRGVVTPLADKANIEHQFFDLNSNAELIPAIHEITKHCQKHNASPILHIESHGSLTAIGRRSDPSVQWRALTPHLISLNRATRGNLFITTATCFGASLLNTFTRASEMPMWGMLGPRTQVLPSDIERGFRAFFQAVIATLDTNTAVEALRAADRSFPDTWYLQTAELLFAIAFGLYRARHEGPGGRMEVERTLLKKVQRKDRKAGRSRPGLRSEVRKHLDDPIGFFEHYKGKYFMINDFPDNKYRFPITLPECEQLFALWQENPDRGAA